MLDPPFPPVQCCSTKPLTMFEFVWFFMDISTLIGGGGDGGENVG